jgi:WD40 repeat protein
MNLLYYVIGYIYILFYSATIASGHLDGKLRLWDVRTGHSTHIYDTIQITCVTVSPGKSADILKHKSRFHNLIRWIHQLDYSHILTTSRDNTLKMIDIRMSKVIAVFS